MRRWTGIGSVVALVMILVLATAGSALAHCDSLDGPVINLARQSLEKGDVKIILPWVAADKEAEIRKAFDLTMAVPDLLTFHDAPTVIEQKLFVMFLEHRMRAFQGSFHANPDYAVWYGWSEMQRDLTEIREKAGELRERHGKAIR
jgi:hypothetical protein